MMLQVCKLFHFSKIPYQAGCREEERAVGAGDVLGPDLKVGLPRPHPAILGTVVGSGLECTGTSLPV